MQTSRIFAEGSGVVEEAMGNGFLAAGHEVTFIDTSAMVPPGTTQDLVSPLLERASDKTSGAGFGLAANPEFLRAASAAHDFATLWMTVIASRDRHTQAQLRDLLAPSAGSSAQRSASGTRCGWSPWSPPTTASPP